MKKIILVVIVFFSLISFGQTSNDKVIYLDSLGVETDSLSFETKRIIENYKLENKTYNVKEYNSQNILLISKQVKNKDYLSLDGEYIEFYPNGNKKKKLQYENYSEVGEVKAWYSNGNLEFEGNYKLVDKKSELYIENFWDENGVQKVTNGEGVFIETEKETKKDTLRITGPIVKGKKDGVWTNLKESYPIIEDLYKNGELISGKTTHSENETYTYKEVNIHAEPIEGMNGFRKKIATSMRLPEVEKSIEVRVTAGFDIDKDGHITDIKILNCTSPILNNEIFRILKKEPKWKPAFFRGKAVKVSYKLPLGANITGI